MNISKSRLPSLFYVPCSTLKGPCFTVDRAWQIYKSDVKLRDEPKNALRVEKANTSRNEIKNAFEDKKQTKHDLVRIKII